MYQNTIILSHFYFFIAYMLIMLPRFLGLGLLGWRIRMQDMRDSYEAMKVGLRQ